MTRAEIAAHLPGPGALRTLLFGAAGGVVFWLAGLPIPWLTGPIAVTAALAVAGIRVEAMPQVRPVIFVVLGISIGAAVGPDTLVQMVRWPASMAMLLVFLPVTILVMYGYFRLISRADAATALMSAVPGNLSYVLAYSADVGADMRRVVVTQSVRLVILIFVVPLAVAPTLVTAAEVAPPSDGLAQAWLFAVAASVGALSAWRWKLPAAPLIGAMLASSVLHASGLNQAYLPDAAIDVCLVALGCMVGARFHGMRREELVRVALVGVGAVAVSLALSAGFALAVARMVGIGFAQAMVAFSPGGVEAMTLIAVTLDLDPAYVGAHHIARMLIVPALIPVLARFLVKPAAVTAK